MLGSHYSGGSVGEKWYVRQFKLAGSWAQYIIIILTYLLTYTMFLR